MEESIVHALIDDDGAETVALIDTDGFLVYSKGADVEKDIESVSAILGGSKTGRNNHINFRK